METLSSLFLIFVVVACAVAQAPSEKPAGERKADEAQIRQIESDWSEAGATGECVEQRILADDFLGTSVTGQRYTKADKIRDCKTKGADMLYDHLDQLRVRFFGDVAVAWGSENWKRKDGKTGKYVWTDVLVKRNGKWQIVAAQDIVPEQK